MLIAVSILLRWNKSPLVDFFGKRSIDRFDYPRLEGSGIYDLSNLKLSESRQVVERICSEIRNSRIDHFEKNNLWLICEEAETYLRNVRGEKSEEFYRFVLSAETLMLDVS